MSELALMQDMDDSQRLLFQSELSRNRKDRTVAFLLTLFLGGIGAHRYYLGDVKTGIFYTLFFWTFIPGIVALVELFFIMGRVDEYNNRKAHEAAAMIKSMMKSKSEA